MSKSEAVELWAERLRRFNPADTTVAAFCAAEGVSQPSYYYWRRKLRGPAIKAKPKTASPPAGGWGQLLRKPGEMQTGGMPVSRYSPLRSVSEALRSV